MSPRQVLLVVDLVGVAGVDTVAALVAGTPEYAHARARLMAEVNAAVEGLLAGGFQRVRVSDSHLSGSGEANLSPEALHPAAEPCFHPEDAYGPALFEGVHAVACLGMHAAAGPQGFAAHTVDVLGTWTCGGRTLSEAELVLGLAAEAGLPCLFVSGDDVLQEQLGGRVRYVRTKTALSATRAFSRAPEEVLAELAQAAAQPGLPVEGLPEQPLLLTFKSTRQATLAVQAGARPVDLYKVEVEGRSFRERYTRALHATTAARAVLGDLLREPPGSPGFLRDVSSLFRLSAPPVQPPPSREDAAERALRAFLSLTQDTGADSRALRALTLHMLEGHAPAFFARAGLRPVLQAAVDALAQVPLELPLGLPPGEGMARMDAWYVRQERGLSHPVPTEYTLRQYLQHLDGEGYGLYAWLLGELGAQCGVDMRLLYPERALRPYSYVMDLYWLTHLYLLDTRYLRTPLRSPQAAAWTEELLAATPWLVSERQVDLAAEFAFCLQCAGEQGSGAHEDLLALLAAHQQPDGRVLEDVGGQAEENAAHSTAGTLLAFAGAEERRELRR
jgi:D-amino peptidase